MILFTTIMTNAIIKKNCSVVAFVGHRMMMMKTKTTTSTSSSSSSLHNQMRRYISSSSSLSSNNNNDDDDDIDTIDGSSSSSISSSSSFFANSDVTFESMGIQSSVLLDRLHNNLGLERPTQIQAKAFTEIRGSTSTTPTSNSNENFIRSKDVTIGAETGSGKTLAYLLPLIDDILCEKAKAKKANEETNKEHGVGMTCLPSYDYARAIILVPNKELVQQVLRMALPLCGGRTLEESIVWAPGGGGGFSGRDDRSTTNPTLQHLLPHLHVGNNNNNNNDIDTCPSTQIRLAVMPGGLREPMDFKPFRDSIGFGGNQPPVDLVITTPTSLGPLGLPPKFLDLFADVSTLVVDEADMLLDGGYIRALENVFMGFRRADKLVDPTPYKSILSPESMQSVLSNTHSQDNSVQVKKTQHVFVAATLPDVGLKSVDAYLQRKFPYANRINTNNMHNAKHYGLSQPTKWYQVETKKERLELLVEMLLRSSSNSDGNDDDTDTDISLKGEKTMVFLNSVDDVEMVYEALIQRGINAVPYHAKISLTERSTNLDRFRRYNNNNNNDNANENGTTDDTVPVLVCTDLASRGLDVPGVTAVVQLQFSGNVVSHLHRMGRCGRAGSKTGRGIVFYDEKEAELVDVVQDAEIQQETMKLQGQDVDFDIDDRNNSGYIDNSSDENKKDKGKVQKAFSRKRGFTKKRKKLRREERVED